MSESTRQFALHCAIPVNMVHRRVFTLFYVWLFVLALVTIVTLVHCVLMTLAASQRRSFIVHLLEVAPVQFDAKCESTMTIIQHF